MNILFFNWRDIRSPKSGGAEVVTHEVAKRLVDWGNTVSLFSSSFAGSKPEEIIDGVKIIRRGSEKTVHWQAYRYYKQLSPGRFDLIVDEINTIPFFTPLYAKEKVVAYINQLARDVWFYEAKFPLNFLGYNLEPLYLRPYRHQPVVTISNSTKEDLLKLGFDNDINLIPMATGFKVADTPETKKEKEPTFVYIGRLTPSKRVEDILAAFELIKAEFMSGKLWIIGDGKEVYKRRLINLARSADVNGSIVFWGHVTQQKKMELLRRAHVLLCTSVREGWGLTVTEANSVGTPAVVYDVSGLRDSTIDNETGLICKKNNHQELANNAVKLLVDKEKYARMQACGRQRSRKLSWDKTADAFLKILENIVG